VFLSQAGVMRLQRHRVPDQAGTKGLPEIQSVYRLLTMRPGLRLKINHLAEFETEPESCSPRQSEGQPYGLL
jgi:hypothetical protein